MNISLRLTKHSMIRVLLILVIVSLLSYASWFVRDTDSELTLTRVSEASQVAGQASQADPHQPAAEAVNATATSQTPKITPKTVKTTSSPKPAVTPTATPAPVSTGCLPANADQYQSALANKKTTEVLQDNGYSSTQKFYEAIVFAGLANTVNADKTVVFAINDYVFENLSQAQKDFLYASPENMKSVLKWQIVPSCVIWSGNIENTTSDISFQTLGGSVTHHYGSPGNIDGVSMAMWDFFSSNGSMHLMSGLIKPPQL